MRVCWQQQEKKMPLLPMFYLRSTYSFPWNFSEAKYGRRIIQNEVFFWDNTDVYFSQPLFSRAGHKSTMIKDAGIIYIQVSDSKAHRPTQPYLACDTITRPKGLFAHLNQNCWNVATLHGMACGLGGHNNKKLLTATSLLSIIFATVGMLVIQATWLSLL